MKKNRKKRMEAFNAGMSCGMPCEIYPVHTYDRPCESLYALRLTKGLRSAQAHPANIVEGYVGTEKADHTLRNALLRLQQIS